MNTNINYELDMIFNTINTLLIKGMFKEIDYLLHVISTSFIINDAALICGVLTITFAAKSKLNNRKKIWLLANDRFNPEIFVGLQ